MTDNYKLEWDQSYRRHENTLFYPSEEVIRFVNRYIRRRVGPDVFTKEFDQRPKVLDIGCGAGRHLAYLWENGFHPIGIELSTVACDQAIALMESKGAPPTEYEIINLSTDDATIADNSIDYAVSVSAIDSMPTANATEVVAKTFASLKPGALFYVDLISVDRMRDGVDLGDYDQTINELHERGTVQSYYDEAKIRRVFSGFEVMRLETITRADQSGVVADKRWHIVLRKPD
jgi:SAM-dependent methyltransferase